MSEWISVEDRIPEYEKSCLVFVSNLGVTQAALYKDGELSDVDGKWLDYDTWHNEIIDDDIEFGDVTHWMPLPEPPQA